MRSVAQAPEIGLCPLIVDDVARLTGSGAATSGPALNDDVRRALMVWAHRALVYNLVLVDRGFARIGRELLDILIAEMGSEANIDWVRVDAGKSFAGSSVLMDYYRPDRLLVQFCADSTLAERRKCLHCGLSLWRKGYVMICLVGGDEARTAFIREAPGRVVAHPSDRLSEAHLVLGRAYFRTYNMAVSMCGEPN